MKLYRLERDTNWNYGIRYGKDHATFEGKRLEIFLCKFSLGGYGELQQIIKGFYFEIFWIMPKITIGKLMLRTKLITKKR